MNEVTPSTLYFCDRPKRIVGHMSTADFVDLWGEGANSFKEDPPSAVLAFLEPGDQAPEDAVVVIKAPRLENGHLSYSIETLEGAVSTQTGPVTLFIDPFGRPLSSRPYLCAEFASRERRRARRRFWLPARDRASAAEPAPVRDERQNPTAPRVGADSGGPCSARSTASGD